jgi:hypothetical protein
VEYVEYPERLAPPRRQCYLQFGCGLFTHHRRPVPSTRTKRALRAFFSALLANAAALDFVDYTKGLDKYVLSFCRTLFFLLTYCWQCYLRLTTHDHAQALLNASQSTLTQQLELPVGGNARGGALEEGARESACPGGATCRFAGAADSEGCPWCKTRREWRPRRGHRRCGPCQRDQEAQTLAIMPTIITDKCIAP